MISTDVSEGFEDLYQSEVGGPGSLEPPHSVGQSGKRPSRFRLF